MLFRKYKKHQELLFAVISILLFLSSLVSIELNPGVSAQALYPIVWPKWDSQWEWTPAAGNPDHYIVEKFTRGISNEIILLNSFTTLALVEDDGKVHVSLTSTSIELFTIRVVAIDAAGNQGPYSPESEWLLILPNLLGLPGQPMVK